MITIFKNKEDIPSEQEYIELNDVFFNQNTASMIDSRAEKYIESIDGSKLVAKYKIRSRFDDVILDIDKLSAGCKTLLNILYYPEKVFCLKECGSNVLELIYRLAAGNVFSEYAMIPFDMYPVIVQTKFSRKVVKNYEDLKEWWDNEK